MPVAKTVKINGAKLAVERAARHLSQSELADAVGKSESWIAKLENGQRGVFLSTFREMSKALGLTPEQLQSKVAVAAEFDANVEPYGERKYFEIPLFDLSLAAGPWSDVTDIVEAVGIESIKQGLFRVRLAGDSMIPVYKSGTVVEFECLKYGIDRLMPGRDYYVQKDDGTATFKRLRSATDEQMTLIALNKRKYPEPMIVESSSVVRMAVAVAVVSLINV